MITVSITYPNIAEANFDWDYYVQVHLPKVGQKLLPHGLTMASVLQGSDMAGGGAPQFIALCLLTFRDDLAARTAMASPGAQELAADVRNFTNIRPEVQFNVPVG